MRLKRPFRIAIYTVIIAVLIVATILIRVRLNAYLSDPDNDYYYHLVVFTDQDFGYKSIRSHKDKNHNGIDDTMDFVYAARKVARTHPFYKDGLYEGGYPPDGEGVCTDMIWRSFKLIGIDFKALIDEDIANNTSAYTRIEDKPYPNIDFRRVPNIATYLKRHCESLTTNLNDKEEWQAGDIVIFRDSHIAIVSDYRDEDGYPYLIHHADNQQKHLEEDVLVELNERKPVTAHYRWPF